MRRNVAYREFFNSIEFAINKLAYNLWGSKVDLNSTILFTDISSKCESLKGI